MIQTDFGHLPHNLKTQTTITHLLEEINILLNDNLFTQQLDIEDFQKITPNTHNEHQHLLSIQNHLQTLLTYYIKIK